MAAQVCLLLLVLRLCSSSPPDSERGKMELRRVQSLAAQPRYGECWARALDHLDTRCRELTSESQSRIALSFTLCHLSSSGRDFPSCPEGSEVSRCTGVMDAVAFNTYTEFFTHTHSICHFLQSEAWQSRTEDTIYRLSESSAGVAEQLQSTRQMAEELIDAQSAALQAQQEILNNGEELRVTLRDSTQGLRTVFSELSSSSQQQQVALSELFNRVSFLQNFLLMEANSLSSCCYNAAALCSAFLLTATPRSARARLLLLSLVCLNFYLERKIYQFVINSDQPEHTHMELVSAYVSVLRRFMVCVGVCVLLFVCVRYRDPLQESLQVLKQLRDTQRDLQEVLQHAEILAERQMKSRSVKVRPGAKLNHSTSHIQNRSGSGAEPQTGRAEPQRMWAEPLAGRVEPLAERAGLRTGRVEIKTKEEEVEETLVHPSSDSSDLSHFSINGWSEHSLLSSTVNSVDVTLQPHTTQNASVHSSITHKASAGPVRRPHRSSTSSPLVYSIQVEDRQPCSTCTDMLSR